MQCHNQSLSIWYVHLCKKGIVEVALCAQQHITVLLMLSKHIVHGILSCHSRQVYVSNKLWHRNIHVHVVHPCNLINEYSPKIKKPL